MTIGMISEGGSGDVHTLARSTIVVSTQSLFFLFRFVGEAHNKR